MKSLTRLVSLDSLQVWQGKIRGEMKMRNQITSKKALGILKADTEGDKALIEFPINPITRPRLANLFVVVIAIIYAVAPTASAQEQLFTNGNFETGNFTGWTVNNQSGGSGNFFINAPGAHTPDSGHNTVANPSGGSFYAVSDQGGPGSHLLYQRFFVPANATSLTLTFQMFVNNWA